MFGQFTSSKQIEEAGRLLLNPPRENHFWEDLPKGVMVRWTVGEYFNELKNVLLGNANGLLNDFLPALKKESSGKGTVRIKELEDVIIDISDEEPTMWSDYNSRKDELIKELKERLEKDPENELLKERLAKIKENEPSELDALILGEYSHDERRITLYPKNIEKVWTDARMFPIGVLSALGVLSVLAHELFHAYHANCTRAKRDWVDIAKKDATLIESLAAMNERLFLRDCVNIYEKEGSWMGQALNDWLKDKLDGLAKHDPELWPYSGVVGIEGRLRTAKALGMNDHRQRYIKSLINGNPDFENDELIVEFYR